MEFVTHLFSNAGKYDEKCQVQCAEYDQECYYRYVTGYRCPIVETVERRAAIASEGVEPTLHGTSLLHTSERMRIAS